MSRISLMPPVGPAIFKRRAVEEAKKQQKVVDEKSKRQGTQPSDYEFEELIGKGAYGRVYKRYDDPDSDSVTCIHT